MGVCRVNWTRERQKTAGTNESLCGPFRFGASVVAGEGKGKDGNRRYGKGMSD